jgi:class 3 adenylate cyclase
VTPAAPGEVSQAYIRALGRVSSAEAEVISGIAAARRADGEEDDIGLLLEAAVEAGRETFEMLHRAMLRRALGYAADAAAQRAAAVAHVDVVGSTSLLSTYSSEEVLHLVDGLFASGQSAIRGRRVEATKYAGDGVFFAGVDPAEVAHTALDCIDNLDRGFGLTARGGLAFGSVVHRAGDVFGLPVNVCHALTKLATPQTLLAATAAAERIPLRMQAAHRCLKVPGLSAKLSAVEIVNSRPGVQCSDPDESCSAPHA